MVKEANIKALASVQAAADKCLVNHGLLCARCLTFNANHDRVTHDRPDHRVAQLPLVKGVIEAIPHHQRQASALLPRKAPPGVYDILGGISSNVCKLWMSSALMVASLRCRAPLLRPAMSAYLYERVSFAGLLQKMDEKPVLQLSPLNSSSSPNIQPLRSS